MGEGQCVCVKGFGRSDPITLVGTANNWSNTGPLNDACFHVAASPSALDVDGPVSDDGTSANGPTRRHFSNWSQTRPTSPWTFQAASFDNSSYSSGPSLVRLQRRTAGERSLCDNSLAKRGCVKNTCCQSLLGPNVQCTTQSS